MYLHVCAIDNARPYCSSSQELLPSCIERPSTWDNTTLVLTKQSQKTRYGWQLRDFSDQMQHDSATVRMDEFQAFIGCFHNNSILAFRNSETFIFWERPCCVLPVLNHDVVNNEWVKPNMRRGCWVCYLNKYTRIFIQSFYCRDSSSFEGWKVKKYLKALASHQGLQEVTEHARPDWEKHAVTMCYQSTINNSDLYEIKMPKIIRALELSSQVL